MYQLIMLLVYHRTLVREGTLILFCFHWIILVNVYDDERKNHVLELCFSLSVVSIRMSRTRFDGLIKILLKFDLVFIDLLLFL